VGGVLRRQEQEKSQTEKLASDAFSDLSSLLDAAAEVVKLADRYSQSMKQRQVSKVDDPEFYDLLSDMGIANPATKRACGSRYHETLARELSDFLEEHLKRHSKTSVIALTDLYCLINRARGTELISPNDLYQACTMMKTLGLAFNLHEFRSGVVVLQPANQTDEFVASTLESLLNARNTEECKDYITTVWVAQKLSISLALANEQLHSAENLTRFCRDETAHGIYFYKNLFLN